MNPFTVAIMQPYFIPYTGYFRLFGAADLFVIYDCVQFPRRGWVHRNRLIDVKGTPRWLTLPLERAPQGVLIRDLCFAPNATQLLQDRLQRFPLAAKHPASVEHIVAALRNIQGSPLDYIEHLLESVVTYCGIPWRVARSSSLDIPPSFRGQDRILEIVRRLGAARYLNAPGGRDLYDPAAFAGAGVELGFLPHYSGPHASILTRILQDDRSSIADDILATTGDIWRS